MGRCNKVSLIGQKFNKLTVLKFTRTDNLRSYWLCKCDCGNEKEVQQNRLISNNVGSCGCIWKRTFIDLTGQVFNDLKLTRLTGQNKQNCFMYEAICKCGKTSLVEGNDVKSGKIRSCGCGRYKKAQQNANYIKSTENNLYADYKNKAKSRNFSFNLSIDEFRELIYKNCYYCNSGATNLKKNGNKKYHIVYNGIDRQDNIKGYELNNVVTACRFCNQAKHSMTEEFFKEWLNRILIAKTNKTGFWNEKET